MANSIITECERLGRAFALSLSLLSSALIAAIFVLLSAAIAWQATLAIVGLAVVSGLGMFHMYDKSFAAGGRLAVLNAQLQSFLNEFLGGAKLIKANGAIDRVTGQVKLLVDELAEVNIITTAMPGTVRGIIEYVALIGVAVILVLATSSFGMAPANVIVVVALFGRLFPRITAVQSQLHSLNNNVHAIEVVNDLHAAAEAQAERHDPAGAQAELALSMPTSLDVAGVEVRYGDRKVLENVDIRLTMPGMVAVVGGSGAGKSTLVHTLLGLTEPSAGSIRLGQYDFASSRAVCLAPRHWVCAAGDDPLPCLDPAEPDVRQCGGFGWLRWKVAARRAHAHDFIAALPRGYDTIIGDQGVKLSGGQRQRLGIARALLADPVLLVLDEAMSALDAESEREILRTLDELRKQMGILLIAHRLAAVSSADLIYVFEAGRVVESGTWDELMARRGRLYALATAQGVDRVTASVP